MKKELSINELIVNPENYRFDPVDTEEQAIELMLHEKGDEILKIAEHISENGLDLARDIRVLEIDGGKFLVLDGNRRITAIKCLRNPKLAIDPNQKAIFQKISKKGALPEKIQTYIYKNEIDAAKWIKLDHTGKNGGVGQDDWGAPEKERFAYKFEGKISPAMQAVELVEKQLGKKIDTKKLKISTVNRILSNPESRSMIGINIKNGILVINENEEDTVAKLNILFNKIIIDNVPVGEVYNKTLAVEFVRDLFKSFRPGGAPGTGHVTLGGVSKRSPKPGSTPTTAKKSVGTGNVKTAPDCHRTIPPTVKSLIDECYCLDNIEFPNAKMAITRITFEYTLKFIVENTKYNGVNFNQMRYFHDAFYYNGKKRKFTDFTKLKELFTQLILSTGKANAFKNFELDKLHQNIHNYNISALTKDAEVYGNLLMPLIEFMLQTETDLINSLDTSKLV